MIRQLLKSKIHRATVTQADLHYVGSVTVDQDLMDAFGGGRGFVDVLDEKFPGFVGERFSGKARSGVARRDDRGEPLGALLRKVHLEGARPMVRGSWFDVRRSPRAVFVSL